MSSARRYLLPLLATLAVAPGRGLAEDPAPITYAQLRAGGTGACLAIATRDATSRVVLAACADPAAQP